MEVGIISFTPGGSRLCLRLVRLLEGTEIRCAGYVPARYLTPDMAAAGIHPSPEGGAAQWAGDRFRAGKSMVFIGAAGIAVRAIAPWVCDKMTDPGVVVMDEAGRFVVPILSGHVGGANRLARRLGAAAGAVPVITTATDVNGCFAADVFAAENGMAVTDREAARQVARDLLEGKPVGFFSDFPVMAGGRAEQHWLPDGCTPALCGSNIHVGIRPLEQRGGRVPEQGDGQVLEQRGGQVMEQRGCRVLVQRDGWVLEQRDGQVLEQRGCRVLELVPRAVVLGVGCRKGVDTGTLEACVWEALRRGSIHREAVACLATIDVKKQEPAILELAARYGWELRFFSAEELEGAEGEFETSEFVKRTVGVGNVCERAASMASEGGTIILHKQAGSGVTVAVAVREVMLRG